MKSVGSLIRELRIKGGYPLRTVAAFLEMDQAVLSKIERGLRRPTKSHVLKLAEFFHYDKKKMLITFLSDRIIYEIGKEVYAKEALKAAEEQIAYLTFQTTDRMSITEQIISNLQQFPGVRRAWIYGSFSRRDDRPDSDIDLAVETDDGFSYFDLAGIQYQLENAVNRKVDVGFIDSFKPHILKNVKPDLKLIYERHKRRKP